MGFPAPQTNQSNRKHNELFAGLGFVDPKEGTIYFDLTGNFPLYSINGMTAVFILYDWTTPCGVACHEGPTIGSALVGS